MSPSVFGSTPPELLRAEADACRKGRLALFTITLTGRNSASRCHLKGDTIVFVPLSSGSELSLGPFCRRFCCGTMAFVRVIESCNRGIMEL